MAETSFYRNALQSPLEYQNLVDKNQLLHQNVQGNALAFQDRQRAINEQNQIRNVLSSLGASATDEQRVGALRSTGTQTGHSMADSLEKSLLERQKTAAEVKSKEATTAQTVQQTQAGSWEQQIKKANKAIADISALSSADEARQGIANQVKAGALDMQKATALLQSIPEDPAQFGAWQKQMLLGILDAKERLAATKPILGQVDTGGSIGFTARDPISGKVTPVGETPKTQSPDSAAASVRVASEGAANRAARAAESEADRAARASENEKDRAAREKTAVTDKQKKEDEKKEAAQADAESVIATLRTQYDVLDKNTAIPSTEKGVVANVGASIGASPVGQMFGRAVGTESQSARNQIVMARPALVSAIVRATGMSAKSIDSNAELKLMLMTATDPTLDIQANRAALDRLEKSLTSGKFKTQDKPVEVKSDEDYNVLKPGTRFVTPDGKTGTKR